MDRPAPEEYQPRLGAWGHTWRFAAMLLIGGLVFADGVQGEYEVWHGWPAVDLAVGLVALVLTHYRRRAPLAIAVVLAATGLVSASSSGPGVLAAVSLATRRRPWEIGLVGSVAFAAGQAFTTMTSDSPDWVDLIVNAAATGATLSWGMYVGSRRELIWTLRHRAESAEAEQTLRVAQARDHERAAIAREMHDVLAHRISQISLHAGALGFREDLTAEQMRADATLIQAKAHEALTDLRSVLGVLRGNDGELLRPQPTYGDLAGLVAEANEAGPTVRLHDEVSDGPPPDSAGRAAYRIVQEGITNAHKHAAGSVVEVELTGSPAEGLQVVVSNQLGFSAARTPGAGLGLVGLAERMRLAGGTLSHSVERGRFVLRARIPWVP
ncbi:MAG: histidine kinase [Nocardioides sp.]|uniref:sensor histidine kinase n=1 Tax=Nocardioides sp. TaxID=35761 RepID=UPI0039E3E89B